MTARRWKWLCMAVVLALTPLAIWLDIAFIRWAGR